MAKLPRKNMKVFAKDATNNGVFGSAADTTKVLSNDIETLQSKAAWYTGWIDAVLGTKKFPALEEFQAIGYITTYQIAYLFQEGIPEWNTSTNYFTNSIVKKAGTYEIYGSLTNDNQGNALTDATKWVFLQDLSDSALPAGIVYETDVQTVTNKTLVLPILSVKDSEFTIQDNSDATKTGRFELSALTTGTLRIWTMPDATTVIMGIDVAQAVSNKTMDNTNIYSTWDSRFTLQDGDQVTRQARFDLQNIGNGQTRVYKFQNLNGTLALLENLFADTATTKAGVAVDVAVTPGGLKDALGFSNHFTSPETTFTDGAVVSIAHGLGGIPFMAMCELVCKSADGGYVPGMRLPVNTFGAANSGGRSFYYDDTNLYFIHNLNAYGDLMGAATTAGAPSGLMRIDESKWKVVMKALI